MKPPGTETELVEILDSMEPEEKFHARNRMETEQLYDAIIKTKLKSLLIGKYSAPVDPLWKRVIDFAINKYRNPRVASVGSWTLLKSKYANRWRTWRYRPASTLPIICLKADTILLSEVAKPLHREIAIRSTTRTNTQVIGFHHGSLIRAIYRYQCANEYAHCQQYVCPSDTTTENCRSEYERIPLSKIWPVEFKTLRLVPDVKIKPAAYPNSVMVIGHPYNGYRYQTVPGDNAYTQMDVEWRAIRDFKKMGKKVIYKMHPDRIVYGPHTDLCDMVITKPFEKVWHLADAFFTGCTATSTFSFMMMTDRPIYVPWVNGTEWSKEFMRYLDRFSWMPSEIVNNRILYDLKEEKRRFEPCTF